MEKENRTTKTFKKVICLLMTLLMLFGTFGGTISVWATDDHGIVVETGECGAEGDNVTYVLYEDGTLVISGEGEMAYYSFEEGLFSFNFFIKNVVVEKGVTSISSFAFSNCTNLTTIIVSDSVTSIGDNAFEQCESLKSITVDEKNEYYSSVDGILFNKEKSIIKLYPTGNSRGSYLIPDGVTCIGNNSFL